MKTKTIISILVSVSFVTACATEVVVSPTVNEIPTSTSSLEEPATKVERTRTPVPTSTKGYTLADIPICPKSGVEILSSDNFGIPGTIVYQKDFQGLYTVGGTPLVYSQLPVEEEQNFIAFGFSPDGQWFAYSPLEASANGDPIFESPKIILLSADGERIEHTFSVEDFTDELQVAHVLEGFSGYSHWINNSTIYAALYSINPDPNTTRHINDLPKVVDPFMGTWREDLLKDLPPMSSSSAKGISPDLTRMLYMSGDGLVLRDLEQGIDIWHEADLFAGFGALMFWSPDSQTVAYANLFASPEDRTVVLISRNGTVKPITASLAPLSGLLVDDLRWSPDGRYIALLMWEGEETGESILIYDFFAEKYISRCPIPRSDDRRPHIIWSPDNKYLAYVGLDYPLLIMDVQSGELIRLVDNARAVGWSNEFPVEWNPR
jgi:WD40 repeat protein